MRVLGIETSCDETAAAVVENGRVLSNVISSQTALHRPFSGVVPELASRAHVQKIPAVIAEALRRAGRPPEAVAFTRGPGLAGALLVGKVAAQTLGRLRGLPVLGIHHLEGHILAGELSGRPPRFPYLALVVSGGHTDLVLARGYGRYRVLGRTRDDAAGEAFDKVAKLLGLGYPGGPAIDRQARRGDPEAFDFPRPILPGCWDFSFSGLKTSVLYTLGDRGWADPRKGALLEPLSEGVLRDLCASFQEAVVDTLVERTFAAARRFKARGWVLGGGVAANRRLRERFLERAGREGLPGLIPPPGLCTDNGAMIARVAEHRLELGLPGHRLAVEPSLPFENWASS